MYVGERGFPHMYVDEIIPHKYVDDSSPNPNQYKLL